MSESTATVKDIDLFRLVVGKLVAAGMSERDAGVVADVLVFAELRGVASHGVVRVEHYVNRIRQGGINLGAELHIDWVKPNIGRFDAKGGMGHVVTAYATVQAIANARENGMAVVGILNNSHTGALAYYTHQALEAKMASLVCGNTDALVVPVGGKFSFLGSNPFSFGFPGRKQDILVDMATSEIPWGKIINARLNNQPLPAGTARDADGNLTTDAEKAVSLTPFGGPKGYSINVMVEALTGLLVGGVFGPQLSKMYDGLDKHRNLATFILVIDPSVFWGGSDMYLDIAQAMIDQVHAQPAEGAAAVKVPGEIEHAVMERRRVEGIPVPTAIYEYLAG